MRVLFLGEKPESADLEDPAVPPGLTPEKIQAGIDKSMADMRARGWDPVDCMVPAEADAASAQLKQVLAGASFDVIVVGGGLRTPASRLELFETLMNVIRVEAPQTPLAFNAGPDKTAEAAERQMQAG